MKTTRLVKERGRSYGHPREDFARTASLWTAYLGHTITTEDVPMLMILLKVSRQRHRHKLDNLEDIQGYAETRKMLEDKYAK